MTKPTSRTNRAAACSYWLPPATLAAVIFLISSHSVPEAIPSFAMSDKLAHLCVYTALAFLAARAAVQWPGDRGRGTWIGVVALVALYGASDEFHQFFVPTREMSLVDWTADTLGAVVGTTTYLALARLRRSASADV